jgi:hypothetical protein
VPRADRNPPRPVIAEGGEDGGDGTGAGWRFEAGSDKATGWIGVGYPSPPELPQEPPQPPPARSSTTAAGEVGGPAGLSGRGTFRSASGRPGRRPIRRGPLKPSRGRVSARRWARLAGLKFEFGQTRRQGLGQPGFGPAGISPKLVA